MKRLLLLCGLLALLVVPTALADTASISKIDHYNTSFSATAGQTVTVTATLPWKRGVAYAIELFRDGASVCMNSTDYRAPAPASGTMTVTCTDASGAGGDYYVDLWSTTGSHVQATVTVTVT